MRKIFTLVLSLLAITATRAELSKYDLNAPMGWVTCKSMTMSGDYNITGGGTGKSITLKASGGDDYNALNNAINNYSVIILDGSQGDFIISKSIDIKVSNRTIVGINNVRLCTKFYVTPEIAKLMDDNNVKSLSGSAGTGGTLSNGVKVNEACETKVRQLLIDYTGDSNESYRQSGFFSIKYCQNIIIRNIEFVGPGSIDVGGSDLISIHGEAHHVWVDHCRFIDGMDGNLDITVKADFVTVSWCEFCYTERSYNHRLSNLVAGSDDPETQGIDNLNITYVNNIWGEGCEGRMPMSRFGTLHLLNNYYNCAGCGSSVNPCRDAEYLIESNYFERGVKNIFSDNNAKSYEFLGNHYTEHFVEPDDKESVFIPYGYNAFNVFEVPSVLTSAENGAGPTLSDPLFIGRSDTIFPVQYKLVYKVDDEIYRVDYLSQGDSIRLIDCPLEINGYTFDGWMLEGSESADNKAIPKIMPGEDLIIRGYYRVNTYALRYFLMDELYAVDSVAYKERIDLRKAPEKEPYTFSGWSLDKQTDEDKSKALTGQVDLASTGISSEGILLKEGTILAQTEAVVMKTGAADTYKNSSARSHGFETASVAGASIDLSIASQGATNPKDALGDHCDVSGEAPVSGAFLSFDVFENGYLYVFHRASSNKTYLVCEESFLRSYTFAMYSEGAPWGDKLSYFMPGDDGDFISDLSKLQWPEKIALGDAWQQHAGEAGKVAVNGVAVIAFPVREGLHYKVTACASKLTYAGFIFSSRPEDVLIANEENQQVLLEASSVHRASVPSFMPARDLNLYGNYVFAPDALQSSETELYRFDGNVFRAQGEILLYDMLGRCLAKAENEFDLREFPQGIYVVKTKNTCVKLKR